MIWSKIKSWLFTVGAVLLVLFGVYGAGGRATRRTIEMEQQRRNAEARKRTDEQVSEIDRLDDDSVFRRAVDRMRRNQK